MTIFTKRVLASISMMCILLSLSPLAVYGADTQADLDVVKTKVLQLQATDPSLPGGVTEEKGRVGTLLSRLFDQNGKIGNVFLKLLGVRSDNEIMKWDATTGQLVGSQIIDNGTNVAIGSSIVGSAKLDVNGAINGNSGTALSPSIRMDDADTGLFRPTGNTIGFSALGAERMRLTTVGLGIGIDSPTEKLHVVGNGLFSGTVSGATPTSANNFTTKSYVDTALLTAGGGKFVDGTPTATEAVYTGGNVGIGLANPATSLEVFEGTLRVSGGSALGQDTARFVVDTGGSTAHSPLELRNSNGVTFRVNGNGDGNFSGTVTGAAPTATGHLTTKSYVDSAITTGIAAGAKFVDGTDTNDAVYTAGSVGIGTTAPNANLEVSSAGNTSLRLSSGTSDLRLLNFGGANWIQSGVNSTTGSSADLRFSSMNGATVNAIIKADGKVGIGTTTPAQKLDIASGFIELDDTYGLRSGGQWVVGKKTVNEVRLGTDDVTDYVSLYAGNAEQLRINTDGNVGIGTITPSVALEVDGNIIADAPTDGTHLTTKSYVDNAIAVGGATNLNDLSDAKTTSTNLYLGATVGVLATGGSNTAMGQDSFQANTTGNSNTAIGANALRDNTTGLQNTAVGGNALRDNTTANYSSAIGFNALAQNTTGSNNVAMGRYALYDNTTGAGNVAVGRSALANNTTRGEQVAIGYLAQNNTTTGYANVAVGGRALQDNTTGYVNVAVGTSALANNITGAANTAVGHNTLVSNTGSSSNTALGYYALRLNTTGTLNTAVGRDALSANTTGNNNTAVGAYSLDRNTTGSYNTGIGYGTLFANTSGVANFALGHAALDANTTGSHNIGIGYIALTDNTTGLNNVALGSYNLQTNTTGSNNTALGYHNLRYNTTGVNNTAVGYAALDANTTAANNTALGSAALSTNTTGAQNTGVGAAALDNLTTGDYNTSVGYHALGAVTTGQYNTAIGGVAGDNITTGSSNIIIGYGIDAPSATASNQLNIGNAIYGNLATGNVGIGTAAPAYPLHIDKTVATNTAGAYFDFSGSATEGNGLLIRAGGTSAGRYILRLRDGANNDRVNILANGRVGIGTTTPLAGLDVLNDAGITVRPSTGSAFAGNIRMVDGFANTTSRDDMLFSTPGGFMFKMDDGDNGISRVQGFNVYDGAENSVFTIHETLRNVGIGAGAVTPNEKLVVDGDVKILGTNKLHFTNTSDQTYIGAVGSNLLSIGTAGTERVRINAAGNVGIGTTSPSQKLDVVGNANISGSVNTATVNATGNVNAGPSVYVQGAVAEHWFGSNADGRLFIGAGRTGTVKNSINLYNTGCAGGCNVPAINLYADTTAILGDASVTGNITSASPTAGNHLTRKDYVDNLVSQGVSWKAPVATSASATYGACNASKEGWATYNKSDDIIYLCNASAWVNIGSSASVPYATTSTAGRIQLAGDLGGTWNNVQLTANSVGVNEIAADAVGASEIATNAVNAAEISAGAVGTSEVADNTLTANDLAANSVGNSELIDSPTFTTVTGTAAPTAGTHLANKTYVDSTVSGSSFWSLSGNEIDSAAGRYVDINSHAAIGTSSTPGTNVGLAVGETSFGGNTDRNTFQIYSSETIGGTTLTGNRTSYGNYQALTNNKGGTATSGNRSYATGMYSYVNTSGAAYAYQNVGGIFEGRNSSTAGVNVLRGIQATARQYDAVGNSNVGSAYGGEFSSLGRSSTEAGNTTLTTARGVSSTMQAYHTDVTNGYGTYSIAGVANGYDGSIVNAYGVYGAISSDSDDGGSITNGYAGYFHSYGRNTGPLMANSKGIYAEANDGVTAIGGHFVADDSRASTNYAIYADARNAGTNNYAIYAPYGNNHFAGNTGIGTTSTSEKLTVAGNIKHSGTLITDGPNYDHTWMRFGEHVNGSEIALGAGGATILGAGESAAAAAAAIPNSNEILYLASDNGIEFKTGMQGGWAGRVNAMNIASDGDVTITGTVTGATPTASTHLTTKAYVDAAAAAAGDNLGAGGTATGNLYTNTGVIGRNATNYARWDNGGTTYYNKNGNWRMYMTAGGFYPYVTNTMALGASTQRWASIHAGAANFTTITGNGAGITAIAGDNITDGTIDSTEIQNESILSADIDDGTITAADLGANSVGNSELIASPSFTNVTVTAAPTSTTHAANKAYVDAAVGGVGGDNLGNHTATTTLTLGGNSITSSAGTIRDGGGGWVRTYGDTGWYNGTYGGGWNMSDTTWLRAYGNKAVYTLSKMRADAGFDVDGTMVIGADAWVEGDRIRQNTIDSGEIQDNTIAAVDIATGGVATSEILNNTITETDISDSFVARDSNLLDGYNTSASATANTVAVRDGSADVHARLFRSNYATQGTPGAGADFAFRNSTTDNYIRFTNKAGLIAYLGISGGDDNLGNHTATTNLNMNSNYINSAGRVTVTGAGVKTTCVGNCY